MPDLIAVEGSFSWAMLELGARKRVSRAIWSDKGMYLVRNPGEPNQVVKNGDWRSEAGVPVGTIFDYLPNIELCNVDGNFVPYQPSQSDMEANDWILQNNSGIAGVVFDLILGTNNVNQWGYNNDDVFHFGECYIIEKNIPVEDIVGFTWGYNNVEDIYTLSWQIRTEGTTEALNEIKGLTKKKLIIEIDGVNYIPPLVRVFGDDKKFLVIQWFRDDDAVKIGEILTLTGSRKRFSCSWESL